MGISLDQWRVSIGLFHCCSIGSYHAVTVRVNVSFIWELLKNIFLLFNIGCKKLQQYLNTCFLNLQFSIIMLLLLLETGDVESNPGPTHEYTLSVLHLNIMSIRKKVSYSQDNFMDFEVLCFQKRI